MSQLILDNAIGWAHFQLRGGRKLLIWFLTIFAIITMSLVLAPAALVNAFAPGLQGFGLNFFLGFEIFLCLLVGPILTAHAISTDVKERMVESHRLMPVSGSEAILGYAFGPNAIPLTLFAASVLVGSIDAALSGVIVPRFVIASFIIVCFGALLTVIAAYGAFAVKRSGGIWIVVAAAPILGNATSIGPFLPAVAVFCTPFMRKTVFSMQAGADEPVAYLVSELFGVLAGTLFFIGARRRYRSTDEPGFTPWMGTAMVGIWIAASAIGIRWSNLFFWQSVGGEQASRNAQWAVSASVALFFSATPVLVSGRLRQMHDIRRRLNPDFAEKRPVSPFIMVMCCTVLILLLGPLAVSDQITLQQLLLIATVVVASLFSVRYWERVTFQTRRRYSSALYRYVAWGGPPLLALLLEWLHVLPSMPEGLLADPICACSPPIALYDIACAPGNPLFLGIAVQIGLALLWGAIAYATRPNRQKKPATQPDAG